MDKGRHDRSISEVCDELIELGKAHIKGLRSNAAAYSLAPGAGVMTWRRLCKSIYGGEF